MLGLAMSSLRRRKGSAVGTMVALFFAAALVCACGVLLDTGIRGSIPAQRYAATPVVVAADQQVHSTSVKNKHGKTKTKTDSDPLAERAWVSTSVGRALAQVPGARVVADLTFPAVVAGSSTQIWGHNWASAALTPYSLTTGTAPRASDQVVLDSTLAGRTGVPVGGHIVIDATSPPVRYEVVGIARAGVTVTGPAIFFSADEAQRLNTHPGFVAAYGVFGLTAAQAKVAVAGTGAIVSTGAARGRVEFVDAAAARVQLISVAAALGGTTLIVGLLVVVATMALSIQQRRRELALLRAVGATPRQIRRMIGREAGVLGLAASVPGALFGFALAGVLRAEFVSRGVLPNTLHLARGPIPIAAGVVASTVAGWVAARVAARRTARIRPSEALLDAAVERRSLGVVRVVSGLVVMAGAVTLTVVLRSLHTQPAAVPVTYVSALLWLTAIALLAPAIVRAAVAVLGVPLRVLPTAGFLAVHNTRANTRRAAAVITPLALLIGLTATILFVPVTVDNAVRTQITQGLLADYTVRADAQGVSSGVPSAAVQSLRAVAGVQTVTEVLPTSVWIGSDERSALGITAATADGVASAIDPHVVAGSLTQLGPGTIALSSLAAGGRSIGATVPLTLGDGTPTQARLVAVYSRGLGFGDTLLAYGDVVHHVDDPLARAVLITTSSSPPARDQLQASIDSFGGLTVVGRSGYEPVALAAQRSNTEVGQIFVGLIIAFTSIAVINTLVLTIRDRSREISLLRLIGTTGRQVRRALRLEAALIVAVATMLGTGVALLTLNGFSEGMVGGGVPGISAATYAGLLVGATALTLIATAVPARFTLRRTAAGSRWG